MCFGIRAHQRLGTERRQAGLLALYELLRGKGRVVVAFQRRIQRVRGLKGLNPHLATRAQSGVTPGAPGGLHQQAEQALGCAKVAGEQRPIRIDGRHQGNAAKVVALGNHLRAHQHIHIAGVHGRQLALQFTFEAGGIGVDAGHAHGLALGEFGAHRIRAPHVGQQFGQVFFESLGATP